MKPTLLLLSLVLLLAGCRLPGHICPAEPAKISVGMTREEVVKKLGKPQTVLPDDITEVLGYTIRRPWGRTSQFRVKLVGGLVKSYEVQDH
ncbi:MAG: hypothetical protein HY301_01815 [Verrucomicrobia bacterium]|nr:hypothetical protein [Verrucomicrobiota bacterium]